MALSWLFMLSMTTAMVIVANDIANTFVAAKMHIVEVFGRSVSINSIHWRLLVALATNIRSHELSSSYSSDHIHIVAFLPF